MNGIQNCSSGLPWTGSTTGTGSIVGSNVQVTDLNGCCTTTAGSQTSAIQDQDLVWVSADSGSTLGACNSGGATTPTAVHASVSGTTVFTYPKPSSSCTTPTNIAYIGVSQSWAVPYELPYKTALKAFWAAVVAHYGPGFSLPATGGMNYFTQLNYFRFGGSVGSEWYPYCTTGNNSSGVPAGLVNLSPASYMYTSSLWQGYYQEMGNYLQSLGPALQVIHSINAVDGDYATPVAEAGFAVGWSNRFGWSDGFGSQGLSAQDSVNCSSGGCPISTCVSPATCSASNWYPLFQTYGASGIPLELQPIALSDERNTACSPACGPSSTSGDLRVFLPFAVTAGGTDFEIYWRDLSLAYDKNNYCTLAAPNTCAGATSVSLSGWLTSYPQARGFFQDVGQGGGTYCTGSGYQTGSTGNCEYQSKTDAAHGQH